MMNHDDYNIHTRTSEHHQNPTVAWSPHGPMDPPSTSKQRIVGACAREDALELPLRTHQAFHTSVANDL